VSESPTARALRALELLQARPGITAERLADRLGVSDRAARRYVAILREAGVPVQSERGPHGGYRLGRGLRLPPLVFTATEALGLVMAALDGHHAAADVEDPAGSALGKILRVLPENVGRQASVMREHAATVPDRVAARPDPGTTSALVAAVADQRRTRIGYRSASGRAHTFLVDPWAVVVRYGRWYLLCHAHHADAVRTYRVDRIVSVVTTDVRSSLPDDLDPVAALEDHLGRGWEHETRVVFAAPFAEVVAWVRPAMGRLAALDDGRCVLVGSTSNPLMYAGEWLAALPFPFTVEGGPELRDALAEVAARLTRAVTDRSSAEAPGRAPVGAPPAQPPA
jgi:predicted DNA-binding transcriptional regulator YafY